MSETDERDRRKAERDWFRRGTIARKVIIAALTLLGGVLGAGGAEAKDYIEGPDDCVEVEDD